MSAGHVATYCSKCGGQIGGTGTNIFCTCRPEDLRLALAASQQEVEAWRLAAAEVSLAKAGTDVSTPAAFRTAQAKAACGLLAERDEARASLALAQADGEKYHELLYAVSNKCPSETRHQTALRYIRERETASAQGAAKSASPPPETTQGETNG